MPKSAVFHTTGSRRVGILDSDLPAMGPTAPKPSVLRIAGAMIGVKMMVIAAAPMPRPEGAYLSAQGL